MIHAEPTYLEQELQALRATLIVEFALRRYVLDHKQTYPEALAELVPQYLDAIPADPFSTGPVLYQRSGGGKPAIFVYSVGANKRDDDGTPYVAPNYDGPDDISMPVAVKAGEARY